MMGAFDTVWERDAQRMLKRREGGVGLDLPMGVADMDFHPPAVVLQALQAFVDEGDCGYGLPPPALLPAFQAWCASRYDWPVASDTLLLLPGVVTGLALFCHMLDRRGHLVTLTPIYPPFFQLDQAGGRRLIGVPLRDTASGWQLDDAALEAACQGAAALLLCHPHNPCGRAFTAEELARIATIVTRHDLAVCSDEIWSDLTLTERRHQPFASLPGQASRTCTLMAPSKSFNIPGLGCSMAVVGDERLRRAMRRFQTVWSLHVNSLGSVAATAAYTEGAEWLDACRAYLRSNEHAFRTAIASEPRLQVHAAEATYVSWLRCPDSTGLVRACRARGLGIRGGAAFGDDGYVRVNLAAPRQRVEEAAERLLAAQRSLD